MVFTKYHTWINYAILLVVTFVAFILFLILVHNFTIFNSVGTMIVTLRSSSFWFTVLFVFGTCSIIDFTSLSVKFTFFPTITNVLQLMINEGEDMNSEVDAPEIIKKKLRLYKQYEEDEKVVIKDEEHEKIEHSKRESIITNEKVETVKDEIINGAMTNHAIMLNTPKDKVKEPEHKSMYNKLRGENKSNKKNINLISNGQIKDIDNKNNLFSNRTDRSKNKMIETNNKEGSEENRGDKIDENDNDSEGYENYNSEQSENMSKEMCRFENETIPKFSGILINSHLKI